VAEISARSPVRQRVVTLLCRDGSAILQDAYADHIVIAEPATGRHQSRAAQDAASVVDKMPLLMELAAFIEHVTGGPPPKSSVREAADAVKTILQISRLAGIWAAVSLRWVVRSGGANRSKLVDQRGTLARFSTAEPRLCGR
jgi:hypothetical protein